MSNVPFNVFYIFNATRRPSIASSVVSVNIDILEPLLENDEDRMLFEVSMLYLAPQ